MKAFKLFIVSAMALMMLLFTGSKEVFAAPVTIPEIPAAGFVEGKEVIAVHDVNGVTYADNGTIFLGAGTAFDISGGKIVNVQMEPNNEYRFYLYEDDSGWYWPSAGDNILEGQTSGQYIPVGVDASGNMFLWNQESHSLSGTPFTGFKAQARPFEKLNISSIKIQYEDGTPAEDGLVIDVFDKSQDGYQTAHQYTVSEGKITNVSVTEKTVLSMGIGMANVRYGGLEVLNSQYHDNLIRFFVEPSVRPSGYAYVYKNNDMTDKSERLRTITLRKITLPSTPVIPFVPAEEEIEVEKEKTALGETKKRVAQGEDVNLADIPVVFEDGSKLPDGVIVDVFDMANIFAGSVKYTVKDGKISGVKMRAESQYKIGFDVTNKDYYNYEVVGAYKSVKLYRVYARYENSLPLHYDYDEGIEAPEVVFEKILVKKTDGKKVEQPRPTSSIMQLILSDGGFQPEGVLPFRLVRTDNNKSKLVYSSNDGLLTLVGDAEIPYELRLDENPTYKLKEKIEFTIKMDSQGKYQAVVKGYDSADDLQGHLTCRYIELERIDGKKAAGTKPVNSTDECYTGTKFTYNDYKEIYNTKKYTANTVSVNVSEKVKFTVYNATLQRFEKTVAAVNGKLDGLKLVKGHNYIIGVKDKNYKMTNVYVRLGDDNKTLIASKSPYGEIKTLELAKRVKPLKSTKNVGRVSYQLPVYIDSARDTVVNGVTLQFVSAFETIEAEVVDGWVDLSLLEDVNYVAKVKSGKYIIDSFPMTIKDKSEYGAKKYLFNHLSCGSVQALYLLKKSQAHENDTVLYSEDGATAVGGFNFRNGDYTLSARVLKNAKAAGLKSGTYTVLDIDTINMYRKELSPLAYGEFKVSTVVESGKKVKNVYYIGADKKLVKVKFSQDGDVVTFDMDTMGIYNNVIEY